MPPGVPREASEQLADLFRPQSLASFGDEVSRVAWRVKPATYILTENDGVVSPAFQESLAVRSGAEIVRIPHGHAPFQEDPAGFADLLERVAAPLVRRELNAPLAQPSTRPTTASTTQRRAGR